MAATEPDPGPNNGTEEEFYENCRQVMRVLLALNRLTIEQLADIIGTSTSTVYTRFQKTPKGSRFFPLELKRAADFFGVHVTCFFEPAEDLIAAIRTGRLSRPWPVVAGNGNSDGQLALPLHLSVVPL